MNLRDLQSIGSCDPLPTTLGPAIRKENPAMPQASTRVAPGVVQDANGRMRTFDPSTIYNYQHSDVVRRACDNYVVLSVGINDRKHDDRFDKFDKFTLQGTSTGRFKGGAADFEERVGALAASFAELELRACAQLAAILEPPPHPANDLEIL